MYHAEIPLDSVSFIIVILAVLSALTKDKISLPLSEIRWE